MSQALGDINPITAQIGGYLKSPAGNAW